MPSNTWEVFPAPPSTYEINVDLPIDTMNDAERDLILLEHRDCEDLLFACATHDCYAISKGFLMDEDDQELWSYQMPTESISLSTGASKIKSLNLEFKSEGKIYIQIACNKGERNSQCSNLVLNQPVANSPNARMVQL